MPKFTRRQLIVITITSFLTDVSSDMILNLIPLFLVNVLNAQTGVVGLIEGAAETTASVLKVFSGWLSDKLQQRKWLAVIGYGLSAISKPFLFFAGSWGSVLTVRVSDRIGKGIRTAPRDALIADSVDERYRGLAFGIHRAGDTLGAMLGLIIALIVVLAMEQQSSLLTADTFHTLVLISIVPAFLAVLVLSLGASDVPIKSQRENPLGLSFSALDPRFRSFLLIVAIFTLGNSADAFLILRAQERGLTIAGIMGMLITFNLIYAILSGPLGALSDRIGRRNLIIFGWLSYALIYFGFAAASVGWQVWALYGLYGIYYASVEGVAKAQVADLVPSEQRGVAYGYYNAVIGLMALPASVLAGILWQGIGTWSGFGASAPFIAGALLSFVACAMLYYWQRTIARPQP